MSRPKAYRNLLPVLLLVGLAIWIHWQVDLTELRQWLKTSGPWAPILFVSVGIILMSACVPKTVMSISAGALFGTTIGGGLMLILAVVAAFLNYHIGRWWAQQAYTAPSCSEPDCSDDEADPESIMGSITTMAEQAGFASHFLLRLTPVPTMVLSYAMGVCRARQKPYLAAAAVAVIPQILWVHSGTAASLAGDSSTTVAQWISIAIAVVGGSVVAILVPREAMRRIRQSQNSQNPDSQIPDSGYPDQISRNMTVEASST